MFVPEKLRLNKFQKVLIPKNCEFVKRYGFISSPSSSYSGDEVIPMNQSKIDAILEGERIAELMSKEDSNK